MKQETHEIDSNEIQNFIASNGLAIKKLHTLGGPIHESLAFNAELHKDGKLIGYIRDDGNGGGVYIDQLYKSIHGKCTAGALGAIDKALGEKQLVWFYYKDNEPHYWNIDVLAEEMAMYEVDKKEWKAKTRKAVFVQTTNCEKDMYYKYPRPHGVTSPKNAQWENDLVAFAIKHFGGMENIKAVRGLRSVTNWQSLAMRQIQIAAIQNSKQEQDK